MKYTPEELKVAVRDVYDNFGFSDEMWDADHQETEEKVTETTIEISPEDATSMEDIESIVVSEKLQFERVIEYSFVSEEQGDPNGRFRR